MKPPASYVLLGEGVVDVLCRDAERDHAFGNQVGADGAVASAAEADFPDAVDRLDALLQRVDRVLVELLLRAVALQCQPT